jgi:hypothetical protein
MDEGGLQQKDIKIVQVHLCVPPLPPFLPSTNGQGSTVALLVRSTRGEGWMVEGSRKV